MTITERTLRQESFHIVRQRTELPGNVYDEHGQVVFNAGARVDARLVNEVKRRCGRTVYVDQHWPVGNTHTTTPTPANQKSSHASSDRRRAIEARRSPRVAWTSRLRINLRGSGEFRGGRATEVTTHDISAGGMAFTLDAFVYPGTAFEATLDGLPNTRRLNGVVRHCQYVGGQGHRVGVEFTHVREERDPTLQAA